MALVIQNQAMTNVYVPYERPPQAYTLWSAIPRGLQSFVVDGQVLDAIVVGDDALLNLTATLPPNFGYVMSELNFGLAQTGGASWSNRMQLNLQNFYRAPEDISLALAGNWPQNMEAVAQNNTTRTSNISQPLPAFPMIGTPGSTGIQVVISTFNNAQNAVAAGTINAFISFWQFDLEQIRKFPINSPQPVHNR